MGKVLLTLGNSEDASIGQLSHLIRQVLGFTQIFFHQENALEVVQNIVLQQYACDKNSS